MRRALLMGSKAVTPLSVGHALPLARATNLAQGVFIASLENPAPAAGVLTKVQISLRTAGAFTVYTGTISGTTFTVTAYADLTSAGAAIQTFTGLSLPIPSGGVVGFWSGSGAAQIEYASGSNTSDGVSVATKPTTTVTGMSTGLTYSLELNGST